MTFRRGSRTHRCARTRLALLVLGLVPARLASGAGATRDLPAPVFPGATFSVTISLSPPPGTLLAAAEDAPPTGWTVSNISNSGTFDVSSGKVKWGLFFDPSIPATLSYNVTRQDTPASPCFAGTVVFDAGEYTIGGDACLVSVPTMSSWGAAILALGLLTVGTQVSLRRSRADGVQVAGGELQGKMRSSKPG